MAKEPTKPVVYVCTNGCDYLNVEGVWQRAEVGDERTDVPAESWLVQEGVFVRKDAARRAPESEGAAAP